eukprot:12801722-Alexandrium_andersonii.AAC.1
MSASLVGSEMCIRDRSNMSSRISTLESRPTGVRSELSGGTPSPVGAPVSYTHLTLPTICSV